MMGTTTASKYIATNIMRLKIKPEIFDEKRGIAALLIKNFGFFLYVILSKIWRGRKQCL